MSVMTSSFSVTPIPSAPPFPSMPTAIAPISNTIPAEMEDTLPQAVPMDDSDLDDAVDNEAPAPVTEIDEVIPDNPAIIRRSVPSPLRLQLALCYPLFKTSMPTPSFTMYIWWSSGFMPNATSLFEHATPWSHA
ncbi:hypothetical protein NLJ89_g343 [Agrocybe chaxingu]|uniref:Uncharacterized protein n=1 Tax=Agrocybe chaxingu TaxID=84603 RepID=A0A9W8N254_9AGAR|nr:hypothetical protein NLJ89_g343 [Agrocybe chaxingu]